MTRLAGWRVVVAYCRVPGQAAAAGLFVRAAGRVCVQPLHVMAFTHPPFPLPPSLVSPLQEYTTKLAAVQGKGDDYEVAAAQVGGSEGGWAGERVGWLPWRWVGKSLTAAAHLCLPVGMHVVAAALPPRLLIEHIICHRPPVAQVGVEVYSAMNAAIGG